MLVSRAINDGTQPVLFPFVFAPDDAFKKRPPGIHQVQVSSDGAGTGPAKDLRDMRQTSESDRIRRARPDSQIITSYTPQSHRHLRRGEKHAKTEGMPAVTLEDFENQKGASAANSALNPLPGWTTC